MNNSLKSNRYLSMISAALVGFLAGIFADDIVNFRSENRQNLGKEISELRDKSDDVDQILGVFAKISVGEKELSEVDLDTLRMQLIGFRSEAEDVALRVKNLEGGFRNLESAMVELLESAEKISTPDKNKPFVRSVSKFLAETDRFLESATDAHTSYFGL